MIPQLEKKPWPTLGPLVADFIEENLVFGPGDKLGDPAVLDDEKRALLARVYEIYPRGHPMAGRRRFRRVALSLRKGTAKTEFAAWIAACELHPDAPVRCAGWDKRGQPFGQGVTDPFIPLVAYTEEQSEELAYGALKAILEESDLAGDFDIGVERIMRRDGHGKAIALATAPDARDGARTTFQHFDETHRLTLPKLKRAHTTMLANIPKRRLADAWSLETTTAPEPGAGSIAEATMEYARQVAEGKISDSRLFFFHRQAGDGHNLETEEGIRAAVEEASGPAAAWSDIDGIVEQWRDPTSDKAYLERVWLNRLVQSSMQAFDVPAWEQLGEPGEIPDRETITLGFDGARFHDATALVACHVKTGKLALVGLWERPANADQGWEMPQQEIDVAVTAAFERWNVWRMYADPPYWETVISQWAGRFGEKRVVAWYTNRYRAMSFALRAFATAITAGELKHTDDQRLTRHLGNAVRRNLKIVDDQGHPLWIIQKQRADSPQKIDAAMAGVLAWEARTHAIAEGVGHGSIYDSQEGFMVLSR